MSTLFEIENLRFRHILSIDHLTLDADQVTALVGESGSGKTTLLKMLNLLNSPDEGAIYYQGKNLQYLNAVTLRREVVMLQQQPLLFSGNVRENLLIGLRFAEKDIVPDAKLTETLQTVHLNKALTDGTEKFSGGEKQRLALGRVLLLEPHVLLLDEPSSALDAETAQATIHETVRVARNRHITVIMVTHDATLAKNYADRIITIREGKVVSDVNNRDHRSNADDRTDFEHDSDADRSVSPINSEEREITA